MFKRALFAVLLGGGFTMSFAERLPAADTPYKLPAGTRAKCLSQLRAALVGDEFWPSMHAAEALTMAGFQIDVRNALESRVATERDDQRRCGLARELVRADRLSRVSVLVAVLNKKDAYGHTHAAESLYKIGQLGDGARLRQAAKQTENPKLQLMAAAALAKAGDIEALGLIRSQLSDKRPDVRQVSAWLLARLGDLRDVPSLTEAAHRETEPIAKAYELIALASLGNADGRKALAGYLADANPELRTYAAEMVGYCHAADLGNRLVQLLNDPAVDVRVRAAQSLLVLGSGS